jgi:hypothetical protein
VYWWCCRCPYGILDLDAGRTASPTQPRRQPLRLLLYPTVSYSYPLSLSLCLSVFYMAMDLLAKYLGVLNPIVACSWWLSNDITVKSSSVLCLIQGLNLDKWIIPACIVMSLMICDFYRQHYLWLKDYAAGMIFACSCLIRQWIDASNDS